MGMLFCMCMLLWCVLCVGGYSDENMVVKVGLVLLMMVCVFLKSMFFVVSVLRFGEIGCG